MQYYTLKEVCEINPSKQIDLSLDDRISFVPMDSVSVRGDIDTSKSISVSSIKSYSIFREGDVLFAKITPCMENGKGCIAHGLLNAYGAGSTEFIVLRPNSQLLTNKWLYYFLSQQNFRQECKQHMTGSAGQKRVPPKYLGICSIPVPSIAEQRRIVARIEELFSQLDDAEATLQKTKAQLVLYRQAVISSAYPDVPQEEWVRLDSIAEIIGGITKGRDLTGQKTVELPYLRVANVQNGFLDLSVMKTIELKESEKEHYLLKEGDVLYTEGGDRDKLGRGTVWHGEIPECVHQNHVFKARLQQDRALPDYVAYWSMSTYARNYFYEKGKQSVNLASINKTVLSALKIPLPSLEEQQYIISEIEMRLSVCGNIEQTINTVFLQVLSIKQSMLAHAFKGDL